MDDLITPPMDFVFGQDFNYALWNSNTVLTLTNVPWNNDTRDAVASWPLADGTTLNQYIDRSITTNARIANVSTADLNEPVKINIPINRASMFNYIRASNPVQPGTGDIQRDYYYWVIGVRRIATHTTELTLQIDLWATYGSSAVFGNCYIQQGHIGIANSKAFDNHGRDYLTKPEGLDTGGEYLIKHFVKEKVMNTSESSPENVDILVCSTVDLEADAGSLTNGEKALLIGAPGGMFSGLPSGASYYIFRSIYTFQTFLARNKEKPWVTQGIVSITLIPAITRYIPDFNYGDDGILKAPTAKTPMIRHAMYPAWRNSAGLRALLIPNPRYRHLDKLLTSPYCIIEMTTWSATPVFIKPESWNDDNATIVERAGLVPPNQRIVFYPERYNQWTNGIWNRGYDGDDGGEFLNMMTSITSFPTMAILNNESIAYMAANQYSLPYQAASADWAQNKALQGAANAYDQANAGIGLNTAQTDISVTASRAQSALANQNAQNHALLSATSTVGSSMLVSPAGMPGGLASAAAQAAGTSLDIQNRNASTGLSSQASYDAMGASNNNSGYLRDTNRSMAEFAAKGDYQNQIAGINAKVQDTKLMQASTSGQVGGEAIDLIHGNVELSLRWKTIDLSAQASIGEYWLRYGYAVEQFAKLDKLMVMSKFTYWKLKETYLKTAPMPESYRQAIRGMFEKGVTLWANPDDIGNIDLADNVPLEGITL